MHNTPSTLRERNGRWPASALRNPSQQGIGRTSRRATASISIEMSAAITLKDAFNNQLSMRPVPHGISSTTLLGDRPSNTLFNSLRSLQLLYRTATGHLPATP